MTESEYFEQIIEKTGRIQLDEIRQLPPLPQPVTETRHKKKKPVLARFVFLGLCALLILGAVTYGVSRLFVSILASGSGSGSEAVEEEGAPQIANGILTLPESDITIGLPEYTNVDFSSDVRSQTTEYVFSLENSWILDILATHTEYPFSLSEEADYFEEEYEYDRLTGQDDQYVIVQNASGEANCTIVDRINKLCYTVRIYTNGTRTSEQINLARQILNEMIDQSSLVQKAD